MTSLSEGFCAAALVGALSSEEVVQWNQERWHHPTLQVLDVQRFPLKPSRTSPSRFYLAVSDGLSLMWCVVPPSSPLEMAVRDFQLDVGCCIVLRAYAIATAANGLNVVIPREAAYSSIPLSIIGEPSFERTLFKLSARSLLQPRGGVGPRTSRTDAHHHHNPDTSLPRIFIADLTTNPQCVLSPWSMKLRLVWCWQHNNPQRDDRPSTRRQDGCRCVGVDARGDAIVLQVWGGTNFLENIIDVGRVVVIDGGSITWATGETSGPVSIQCREQHVHVVLDERSNDLLHGAGGDADDCGVVLPLHPSRLVGSLGHGLSPVAEVVASVELNALVSVVGVVRSVSEATQLRTKRGRVTRVVVELEDERRANITIDITMWAELAEQVEPHRRERWIFHKCVVREFMKRRTLSTTAGTIALKMSEEVVAGGANASPTLMDVVAEVPTNVGMIPEQMQVVLRLGDASPTLPVLARIHGVRCPVLHRRCARCSTFLEDATTIHCVACGCTHVSLGFRVDLELSDGIALITAVGFIAVAESLFEEKEEVFVSRAASDAHYEGQRCHALMGTTVLVWMLRNPTSGAFTIVNCKYINYSTCSLTLLSAIDGLML